MATIDFKKFGSLVDITATGYTPRLINAKRDDFELTYSADGSKVSIYAKGVQYPPVAVTDVSVNDSAATDMDDLKSKLATVFSAEGGGSGETPGLNAVLDAGETVLDGADAEMAFFNKLGNRLQIEMIDTGTDEYARVEPGVLAVGPTQDDVARIKATNVTGTEDYEIPPGGGKFLTDGMLSSDFVLANDTVSFAVKEYIIEITGGGMGDTLTYDVIRNTMGEEPMAGYVGSGEYVFIFSNPVLTVGKTTVEIISGRENIDGTAKIRCFTPGSTEVNIKTYLSGSLDESAVASLTSQAEPVVLKVTTYP